jgi:cysteine desulfurase
MKYPIYLDYNSTTPCHPEVVEAMVPWFSEHFGNSSSKSHPYGWMAEDAVDTARQKIAKSFGVRSKEIIFTSGATEAINLAISGIFDHYLGQKQHYITCKTEHKAVLDTFQSLERRGAEVTYLNVNQEGMLDTDLVEDAILPHTKMIAFMWANNETGVLHPMKDLLGIAEKHNIILFTDAVQVAGKMQISLAPFHMAAISAHKLYGPKGVGALYIRHNHHLPKPNPIIFGGGHEKGFRSGTLNVPAIVGFGEAAAIQASILPQESARLETMRNQLEDLLLSIPGTRINGSTRSRLNHVSNIGFEGVDGEELLRMVNLKLAVSSGSACTSISPKPSHVLEAMGLDKQLGKASLRFSLGSLTREDDILFAAEWVKAQVSLLRNQK